MTEKDVCVRCLNAGAEIEIVGEMGRSKGFIHRDCLIQSIISLIEKKPEYENILRRLVQYEEINENSKKSDWVRNLTAGKKGVCWSWSDVGIPTARLNKLVSENIVTVVFSTHSRTDYTLVDRETTKRALNLVGEQYGKEEREEIDEKEEEEIEIPLDLFDIIVGHEGKKELILRGLTSDSEHPIHFLLYGSVASAKTLFLEELARLRNSCFVVCSGAARVGLLDVLFEKKPSILILDEIDKIRDARDLSVLLSLMERGFVSETKHGKCREMRLRTIVFASANRIERLPEELLSRFRKLRFREYNDEEFKEVAVRVLSQKEGVPETLALYIAEKVLKDFGSRDIRDAIGVARLLKDKTEEDVERVIRMLKSES